MARPGGERKPVVRIRPPAALSTPSRNVHRLDTPGSTARRHHEDMTRSPSPGTEAPLLCELHAHTTWSDGSLDLEQVVDLYGRRGFDVLSITDHVVRGDDMLTAGRYPAYLAAIREEARRADALYGMLVIPGLELTSAAPADSTRSAHAVAVGLERFVSLDRGIGAARRWSGSCAPRPRPRSRG